jgi:RPA family protein
MFKEDDDEYAPSYLLLPSGGKANRVFIVGVLSDVEEDDGYFSIRVNDSTGTFLCYAGQYQPEAAEAIRHIDAPSFVAVVGKPDTFETDDGDVISTLRPERVVEVDKNTRDQWWAETAEATLERLDRSVEDHQYAEMAEDRHGNQRAAMTNIVVEAIETLEDETA